jgi:serine/threonine protein kinase/Tfp pilus assembly protein PilF
LAGVLEEYLERLEQGDPPTPGEWLARYPGLPGPADEYLAALDLLHRTAVDSRGDAVWGAGRGSPRSVLGRLGDYDLLREVARGGMGVVYEAEQRPFGRRVALKVLPLAGALDARQLRRFHTEALTASQLHHPHIVDVFGAGCEGTVHYYAMRYVEGQTLAQLITRTRITSGLEPGGEPEGTRHTSHTPAGPEPAAGPVGEHAPPPAARQQTAPTVRLTAEGSIPRAEYVRAAARVGAQVAEALDYAHEQGVVHRDIKPSNVILDAQGQAWVTDFGLARVSQQAQLTQSGDLLGTLRYMSPEQALGRRGVLDHRTDVYALGATLYELLTLRPAVPGDDHQEILRRIASDEPARPSLLNPAVPPDLEAIVLKAMAKAPGERYAAGELADDLNRFLNGEPVRARLPTRLQLAARWARRHRRPLLAAASAALLMLTLAAILLAVNNVRLREERERTAAERLETEKEKARVQEALGLEAEQRRRAEENARLAIAVLDEVLMKEARQRLALYAQEETKAPPRTPERERLEREFLEKGLKYYEQLARANATDWTARRERARAYANVGLLRLGMKNYPESEKAYRQAIRLMEELAAERPQDFDNRFDLANNYSGLYRGFFDGGRFADAADACHQAIVLFETLAADFPERSPHAQEYRAYSHRNLGHSLAKDGKPREAEQAFRQASAIWSELAASDPNRPGYRNALASDQGWLGDLFQQTGRKSEAIDAWRQAAQLLEKVVAETNGHESRWQLAGWHERLGSAFQQTDRPREAEGAYRDAIRIWEKLAAETGTPDHRWHLAICREMLAQFYKKTGRVREAEAAYRAAMPLWEKLVAESPNVADYRMHVTGNYGALTELLLELGDHAGAARIAEKMPSAWSDAGQGSNRAARVLARCVPLAEQDTKLAPEDRKALARAYAERSRDLMREAARVAPDRNAPELRDAVARSHHDLAQALRKTGRVNEAETAYREALAIWEKLGADRPDRREYRRHAAFTRGTIADLLADAGRTAEAGEEFRRARAAWEKLVAEIPGEPSCRGQLADLDWKFGNLLREAGKPGEAEECYRRALGAFEKLATDEPAERFWHQEHAYVHSLLGGLYQDTGRVRDADAAFRRSLAVLDKLVIDFPAADAYRSRRGGVHAELGQWDAAAADFARAAELKPDSPQAWYFTALARLGAGDTKGYRAACADTLDRFGQTDDPTTALWVTWGCVVAPDAVADPAPLVPLAEKSLATAPANHDFLTVHGAALYRAGRYKEAAERLGEAAAYRPGPGSRLPVVYSWYFLAMAQHRLGQVDEARRWLEKAVRWVEGREKEGDAASKLPMFWNRRLTLQLLRREAEALILGPAGKK